MQPNSVDLQFFGEDSPPENAFVICQAHHERMIELLKEFGVADSIARTETEVQALIEMDRTDPILDVSKVLFTIALNAIGSKDLAVLKCPVCAFQQFDFLAKISGLVAIKYRNDQNPSSALVTPPPPKLILPS